MAPKKNASIVSAPAPDTTSDNEVDMDAETSGSEEGEKHVEEDNDPATVNAGEQRIRIVSLSTSL